jgi:hypothetical protein
LACLCFEARSRSPLPPLDFLPFSTCSSAYGPTQPDHQKSGKAPWTILHLILSTHSSPHSRARPRHRPARGPSGLYAHGQESRPPSPAFLGVCAVHAKGTSRPSPFKVARALDVAALHHLCSSTAVKLATGAMEIEPAVRHRCRFVMLAGPRSKPMLPGASRRQAAPLPPLPVARGMPDHCHPYRLEPRVVFSAAGRIPAATPRHCRR